MPLGRQGIVLDIVTADRGAPGAWCHEAGNHFHRGRLAGTVRAEKAKNLAGLASEAQIVDHRMVAVVLRKAVDFDHI